MMRASPNHGMFEPATIEMRFLWRVMGSKRARPFFPLIDLPPPIVEQGPRVHHAARAAFKELERHTGTHVAADRAIELSIRQFFDAFEDLRPDDAAALRAWIDRFHADVAQRVRWEVWHQVLSIALTDHAFAGGRELPEHLMRTVRNAAVRRLGAEAWRQVDQARQDSEAIEIDSSEEAILRLETSQVGDRPYIDVAEYLENLVGFVRARAAAQELYASVSMDDRSRLTDWAAAVALWRGRSDEEVALLHRGDNHLNLFHFAQLALEALQAPESFGDFAVAPVDIELIPNFAGEADRTEAWLIFADRDGARRAIEDGATWRTRAEAVLARAGFPEDALSSFSLRFVSIDEVEDGGGRREFFR